MNKMKIYDTRHPEWRDFGNLEAGTMFHEPCEDVWGIVIEDVPTAGGSAHGLVNYVDLKTGEVGYFSDCTSVEELNATIHIH